jgi:DNA replication protein DnaC
MERLINTKKEMRWINIESKKYLPQLFPPRIMRHIDINGRDINSKYLLSLRNGEIWLFITGEQGTGKTILAAQYMTESMKLSYLTYDEKFLISDHLFITSIDLLDSIKRSFVTGTEEQIINRYYNIPFLVIDDLGSEKLTDWSLSSIYKIINFRYENLKATIITTNYEGSELASKLEARIVARIGEMSKVIIMKKRIRKQPI